MKNYFLLLLLVSPLIICTFNSPKTFSAFAEDEIEDDLVDVEGDDGAVTGDDVEVDEEGESTKSPHADTYLLFTKPLYTPGIQLDLPGGKPVEFLIGFANQGPDDFVIETVEASFRYPMDFNYYIQNFSAVAYNREIKSGYEGTVSYSFLPSDTFAGRPFGLNIGLNYRDSNGAHFTETVFNETVLISEVDEGLDGETFFLYVLLGGIVILLLVLGQQMLLGSSGKRKRFTAAKKTIETGTISDGNIDYDWVPEQTLRALQKSPPKSPKSKTSPKPKASQSPKQSQQSPKQRKAKRAAGSDD